VDDGRPGQERSDEDLTRAAQQGDMAAFATLFQRHRQMIANLTYRMTGNRDDADDLEQETFYRAYRALPKFRGDAKFSTWVCRIATNLCLDYRRRRRPSVAFDEQIASEESGLQHEEEWERRALRAKVREAIAALPRHHRSLVVLKDLQHLSYQEIADVLNCSVASVKVRLHRARQALKKRLTGLLEE
jgi:RNA polymerase sigma-70 factor (ECF subfamily)